MLGVVSMKPTFVLGILAAAMTATLSTGQGGPPQTDLPAVRTDIWNEKAIAGDASLRRPVTIYTKKNAPAAPKLNSLPLKSSVSQRSEERRAGGGRTAP